MTDGSELSTAGAVADNVEAALRRGQRRQGAVVAVVETQRLRLVSLGVDHAAFMVSLLNDPDFLRNIGDKGVRSLDDARAYILGGPCASYRRHGFGLWLVERIEDGEPLGICGLLRREALPDVDLGFAFAPAHRGKGYGLEAAQGVVAHARGRLRLDRLVAVVMSGNVASVRLLTRLGFAYERMVRLDTAGEPLCLYASVA